ELLGPGPGGHPYSSTTSVSPSETDCPSSQRISDTLPSSSASTGISIFIDSRMTSVSPSVTSWPTSHSTFQTVPVMWASTSGKLSPPELLGIGPSGTIPRRAAGDRNHRDGQKRGGPAARHPRRARGGVPGSAHRRGGRRLDRCHLAPRPSGNR